MAHFRNNHSLRHHNHGAVIPIVCEGEGGRFCNHCGDGPNIVADHCPICGQHRPEPRRRADTPYHAQQPGTPQPGAERLQRVWHCHKCHHGPYGVVTAGCTNIDCNHTRCKSCQVTWES